jgi:2-dehydropantoate 2-reductase
MESVAPAIGPKTAILPFLNGMQHIDALSARFGAARVLGGLAFISATLDDEGIVLHLNELHTLVYGELDGSNSPRIAEIAATFAGANFDARVSHTIVHELWEKWVFIASLASVTCLMRALVGDVERADAADLAREIFAECSAIAASQGHPPRPAAVERGLAMVTTRGSTLTASMMKDIERGAPIEGEQIIGDLLARGNAAGVKSPLLRVVHAHLKSYEVRREREKATA